ncbi:MAG: hypothetical protein ACKOWG_13760, partial [Planctomycetia bacterium]
QRQVGVGGQLVAERQRDEGLPRRVGEVLREIRGLSGRSSPRREKASPVRETAQSGRSHAEEAGEDVAERETGREAFDDGHDSRQEEPVVFEAADGSDADDEGERAGRHLSKAERKRLKKLARMGRAA